MKVNAANIFITASVVLASCKSNTVTVADRTKYEIPDSLFKTLKTDSVIKCPLVNNLTLTGKVAFNDEKVSKIFPLVSGNIMNVNVQLGDYVHKEQSLGIIRSGEMAGYGNDLISAKTNLLVAQKNLSASEDMYKSGLISQKDYIIVQAMYKQAESQLTRAQQILQINGGSTQGQFIVRAPIDGFIVEKQITNNMSIRPDNTNSLFTISDLKNVWVLANVYESNIDKIHLGDDIEVTTLSYPSRKFTGKVDKIFNVLDPTNKVMKIRVVLNNPDYALKPEMFASVTVSSKDNRQSLCIPSSALIFDNSRYYVLQFKSKSDVKIIPVQVISTNADKTYISGGLQQGDKIIASETILIYDALNS
jgi:cobalt-zinc-cadmium efflux system membrane fusion protein